MRVSQIAAVAASGLVAGAAATCEVSPFPMSKCNGIKIEDAHIDTLQQYMIDGKLTSRDLVTCYLARIEETNEYTHSISEVNPDALSIADAMDEERASGHYRGPMHGIPFVSKDNIYTDDKHNTSEGTLVLLGGKYSREATVMIKIREAGGVLLGHSTMSEAADHRANMNYASGYSSRTGQTRNPYNLTQPTAGSSSGSVVAIRANQAPIAIGTETYGSLTHPSGALGLYTIKSTPGLMSRHGVVTGSYWHDTPGPLARSMKDVAVLLDIMGGYDNYDNLTSTAVGHYPESGYTSEIVGKQALKGIKLGMPWYPYWSTNGHMNSPGIREEYMERIVELEAAGATIYNVTTDAFLEIASLYGSGHPTTLPAEFNHAIAFNTLLDAGYAEWLTQWTFPESDPRHGMSTLREMADWNDAHNDTTGSLGNGTWWWDPVSGQNFYDAAIATQGRVDGSEFWTAFGWGRATASKAIDVAHAYETESGDVVELDGLLVPNGRAGGWLNACAPMASWAGHPVATVPTGLDGYGAPYGLCVYGRRFGEARLVKVASAMEDLFRWNEKPMWYNYKTAEGPWEAPWPGYTCTNSSLDAMSCVGE